MIEGQMGLDWPRWKAIAAIAERAGFAGLYRSDHFCNPAGPDQDALEMVTSLAYLATATSRLTFGPLVAPVSFRHPVQLARQAAAIDELSGGRMILGLGAGWMDREHERFGFELGSVRDRLARLEEALQVTALLLRSDEPATFEGRFYRLRDAIVLPRATRARLCVGGNGLRGSMPLAARYADVWNGIFLNAEAFRERSRALDEMVTAAGRAKGDVRRTLMTGLRPGSDDENLRAHGAICGTPDQMRAQLDALAAAGCDEVMLQWLDLDDLDGLELHARDLLR